MATKNIRHGYVPTFVILRRRTPDPSICQACNCVATDSLYLLHHGEIFELQLCAEHATVADRRMSPGPLRAPALPEPQKRPVLVLPVSPAPPVPEPPQPPPPPPAAPEPAAPAAPVPLW